MRRLTLITSLLISAFTFAQNERDYAPVNPLAGTFATQWMTYVGAADSDELLCVRDMPDKGVVVCGRTMSNNFPGTDSLDSLAGNYDMVIFRMDSLGQILWTVMYGGQFYETANSLVVYDTVIYVVGSTNGNDCPMVNAFQPMQAGSYDAVILRLGFDGTLQQSSYFGGFGAEQAYGIDVDSTGKIVIGGASTSTTIPQSTLGYQQNGAGANDLFIAVLDSTFAPVWSTFYGGTSTEDVHTLLVTSRNQIIACGGSFSINFPCTPGAFQNGKLGVCDAYYVVFEMDGTRKYATYYGGSGNEDCFGIAGDADGNVYLSGHTSSIDFNTAGTIFQPMFQGVNDAWVARFDSTGVPYFSTFFGGTVDDKVWSMFRRDGYLYISGVTSSPDLFMNVTAPQDSMWGGNDGFIVKFDTAGNYVTSTYFGGSGVDDMMSITVNADTVATGVGTTYSSNLPVLNPYQANYVASGDGFAVRYKLSETWSSNEVFEIPNSENTFVVYPNPASTFLYVHGQTSIEQIDIFDMTGKVVLKLSVTSGSNITIDISGLSDGIYFVQLLTADGVSSASKLVISE
jgi:hypothetical protein